MKTAAWFIVSELLLVLTIVLIFSNWQGSVNLSFSSSLSGSAFTITGGAHGGRVLLAIASALLTVATFIVGLVRLVRSPRPRPIASTALPATPPREISK